MKLALARLWVPQSTMSTRIYTRFLSTFFVALALAIPGLAQSGAEKKLTWKSVEFAILKFNDEAPKSWNIYHSEKRGILLVRIWKRVLLVNVPERQVFDLDPATLSAQGENVQWSFSDLPEKPIETSEWKERNVGPVERIKFRLGKEGHVVELQIPLRPDGKPMY